jgi:toxin FitB
MGPALANSELSARHPCHSEWVRPRPDPNVVSWLAEADEDRIFVSVVAFAEIRRGIELMPVGKRRERLAQWLAEELPTRFANRIVAIDQQVAELGAR